MPNTTDQSSFSFDSAEAIAAVIPNSRWIGARMAAAQLQLRRGRNEEAVARELYESGSAGTLTRSREVVSDLRLTDFTRLLDVRKKKGSAENPITKLFPAAITERQFLDELDHLHLQRPSIRYDDKRFTGHTLVDFTILEGDLELPINVKNAGTRFENALQLVGIEPNDCVPIPAYKAHDAVEKEPNLLYAVSIDYALLKQIQRHLIPLFTPDETEVWRLLNTFSGTLIRDAEDAFVYTTVNKYWESFHTNVALPDFRVISARKSIRVLNQMPKRTPGIGLRAWGTGASAEVNVHIKVSAETKPWSEVFDRIEGNGIGNIITAVNRKRTEVVYDPEI